ncbi:MAG: hypothetical protein AB7R89_11125 [Dehalococcoidia bacterium]
MAGRKTKLTPETQATIVAAIRKGAFAYIAAEAAGIDNSTFYLWLKQGEHGREPYRTFRETVLRAHAEARAAAEARVYEENPLAWLKAGPGQSRPGRDGWTEITKHELSDPDGKPVSFTLRIDRGTDHPADRV